MPRATSSQRVIPPKTLKKIDFTCGSRVITSSASTTPSARAAAAEVAEVRGLAADVRDDVHRRHGETRAVAADADGAVELHVRDALLARERLERVGSRGVAHLGDVGMAEERVVVDGELRVERLHLAGRRDDQRVDLAEHRVELDERPVELLDDRRDLLLLGRILDVGAVDEPARDPRLEALEPGRRAGGRAPPGSPRATCSISTPPCVVNMNSGFFAPRSNVIER